MSRIALVDPGTLLGEAFREAAGQVIPGAELELLTGDAEGAGTLISNDGEVGLVDAPTAATLESVDLVVLNAGAGGARSALDLLPPGTPALLLTAAEGSTSGVAAVAGVNDHVVTDARVVRSPHAAVVALAHLVAALDDFGPSRVSASALLPASIHNHSAGLDELFEQTRALLNFEQHLPTELLGRPLAFNVLPVDGGLALDDELSEVLGYALGVSIQPLQGPVFHGTAISAAVQLTEPADAALVTERLSESRVIEVAEDGANLGPKEAAGQDAILLGEVRVSPDGCCRIWAVLDNLTRGGALNALELAKTILASQ